MTLRGKPTLISFLIWVSVTVLVSGFLLFRDGQISSRHKQHVSPSLDEDQPGYKDHQPGYKDQEMQTQGGLFPHIINLSWESEINPTLSEKRNEEFGKRLIFRKLLDCFESAERHKEGNRRFLRSCEDQKATSTTNAQDKYTKAVALIQVDYSGPETHPPKNN